MDRRPVNYLRTVCLASLGILMSAVGLYFSYLSNPRRFSLAVGDDQYIYGYSIVGLGLTLVGLALFIWAANGTTVDFAPKLRREINTGIGIGFALQCTGLFVSDFGAQAQSVATALIFILPGIAAFTRGTIKFASGKGYAWGMGLLGLLGVVGLINLILLPSQTENPAKA